MGYRACLTLGVLKGGLGPGYYPAQRLKRGGTTCNLPLCPKAGHSGPRTRRAQIQACQMCIQGTQQYESADLPLFSTLARPWLNTKWLLLSRDLEPECPVGTPIVFVDNYRLLNRIAEVGQLRAQAWSRVH